MKSSPKPKDCKLPGKVTLDIEVLEGFVMLLLVVLVDIEDDDVELDVEVEDVVLDDVDVDEVELLDVGVPESLKSLSCSCWRCL